MRTFDLATRTLSPTSSPSVVTPPTTRDRSSPEVSSRLAPASPMSWTCVRCDDTEPGPCARGESPWAGIDDAGQKGAGAGSDGIVDWALDGAQGPERQPLTHCHMGINRGPSAATPSCSDSVGTRRGARRNPDGAADRRVAYAEDALAWHFDRMRQRPRADDRSPGLRRWRADNPLDVVRMIRRIRLEEAS